MTRLRRTWKTLAGLSLSIWLLLLSSLLMLLNSHLATRWPEVYHALNTTPIWTWLRDTRTAKPAVFAAIVMLLASLGAFAVNILACTLDRLGELLKTRMSGGPSRAFVAWAPTLMHVLFFLVLAGHMATFSLGRWQNHVVRQGQSLRYSPGHPPLVIGGFSRSTRQVQGALRGSVIAHRIELRVGGKEAVISELRPLRLGNGDWLLLLPPQQKSGQRHRPLEGPVDCSGEERHARPIPFSGGQPITLKQVSDPGVHFLFFGFGLILVLMGLHYALRWKREPAPEK